MGGFLRKFRDSTLVAFSILEMDSFSRTSLTRNFSKNHSLTLKKISERRKLQLQDGKSIRSRVLEDVSNRLYLPENKKHVHRGAL